MTKERESLEYIADKYPAESHSPAKRRQGLALFRLTMAVGRPDFHASCP
jgi:hypothetical protein